MAETSDFDPIREARRITNSYLSSYSWSTHWQRVVLAESPLTLARKAQDEKIDRTQQMREAAEDQFSSEVEKWRNSDSRYKKEVLSNIVRILGPRKDLGYFARRAVDWLIRNGYE